MYQLQEIKHIRRKLGITQAKLAEMSGVSQSLIAKIESGKVDPGYTRALKIFTSLDQYSANGGRKAEDVMVEDLITIPEDRTVGEAVRIMNDKSISQLPVTRGNEIVGSISDGLLVGKVASGSEVSGILGKKVFEIMDEPFPTVSANTPLELVAKILSYYNAVLVYRHNRRPGIITRSDLLRKS